MATLEALPLQPNQQRTRNGSHALLSPPKVKESKTRSGKKGSANGGGGSQEPSAPGEYLSTSGRLKRTFKEKLLAEVSAAEAEAAARQQVVMHDKQQLCIETLAQGRPQAFIDLFNLTHARVASGSTTGLNQQSAEQDPLTSRPGDEIAPESLGFLQENLIMAEAASRRGDQGAVYNAYNNLAKYFGAIENHSKSIFFYTKCLEVAKAAGHRDGEIEANHNLGLAQEHMGGLQSAIAFHERHLELATEAQDEEEQLLASHSLVQVYRKMAEEMEAGGDLEQSVEYLQKCLQTAQGAQDRAAEGTAFYRLGLAHEKMGQPQAAITCHNQYLALCREAGDKVGEGTACCALAQAYEDLGDVAAAILNLENFLELAKSGEPASQARACCSLGVIYHQQQKFDRAVTYFDKFFEIARSVNDTQMLEVARINSGIARASLQFGRYMEVVSSDLPTLLQWKNARTPIAKS